MCFISYRISGTVKHLGGVQWYHSQEAPGDLSLLFEEPGCVWGWGGVVFHGISWWRSTLTKVYLQVMNILE